MYEAVDPAPRPPALPPPPKSSAPLDDIRLLASCSATHPRSEGEETLALIATIRRLSGCFSPSSAMPFREAAGRLDELISGRFSDTNDVGHPKDV